MTSPSDRKATIIDGKAIAQTIRSEITDEVRQLSRKYDKATFECLLKTYGFLTPDFWKETRFSRSPFQEYTDLLGKPAKTLVLEDAAPVDA